MKNIHNVPLVRVPLVRIFGIIALVALIGFTLAGCESREQRAERERIEAEQRALAEIEEAIQNGDLSVIEEKLSTASPELVETAVLMALDLVNDGRGAFEVFNAIYSAGSPDIAAVLTQSHGNPSGDFGFAFNSAGDGVVINYYNGNGGVVIIPAEIDGYPVVEIAARAFSGALMETNTRTGARRHVGRNVQGNRFIQATNPSDRNARASRLITTLIIPDTVTTIGHYAFNNMTELRSLTLSRNLALIPFGMSNGNANLAELKNIPPNVSFETYRLQDRFNPIADNYTYTNVAHSRAFINNGKLPLPVRRQLEEAGYRDGF